MRIGSAAWVDYTVLHTGSLGEPCVYMGAVASPQRASAGGLTLREPLWRNALSGLPSYVVSISDAAKTHAVDQYFDPAQDRGDYRSALQGDIVGKAASHLYELYRKTRPASELPDFSGMTMDEVLTRLSENGGFRLVDPVATAENIAKNADKALFFDADILLHDIDSILKGGLSLDISVVTLGEPAPVSSNAGTFQIDSRVETLASVYAFYESKAAAIFTGEDYGLAMGEVEKAIGAAVEAYAADLLNGPYGEALDRGTVENSIQTLVDERKTVYMQLLGGESFRTGLEGTSYEWLREDSWFMSNKLQSIVGNSENALTAGTQTSAAYNMADLKAIAAMNAMSQTKSLGNSSENSEESLGYLLGMDKAMLETMAQSGKMSEKGVRDLSAAYAAHFTKYLDQADAYFDSIRNAPYYRQVYSKIDRSAVRQAADLFASTLEASRKQSKSFYQAHEAVKDALQTVFFQRQRMYYEKGVDESRYLLPIYGNRHGIEAYLAWNQGNRALTMPKVLLYLDTYFGG